MISSLIYGCGRASALERPAGPAFAPAKTPRAIWSRGELTPGNLMLGRGRAASNYIHAPFATTAGLVLAFDRGLITAINTAPQLTFDRSFWRAPAQ